MWWDTRHTNATSWHNEIASKRGWRFDRPMSRRARHQRNRSLAEMVEGISQRHDQQAYGTGPFGRLTIGGWRWKR